MCDHRILLQCLLSIKTFETYWAYFCLSEGRLYSAECRRAAGELARNLSHVAGTCEIGVDPACGQKPDHPGPLKMIDCFAAWSEHNDGRAVEQLLQRPGRMHAYLSAAKRILAERLGLANSVAGPNGSELLYRESFIRWQAHFPTVLLMKMSKAEEMLEVASSSETIVVMGDIRHSQDLMTCAGDRRTFMAYMVRFVEGTRRLLDDHFAVFDKFTGDGFLAYFNKALCDMQGHDFRQCFLEFVRKERTFAAEHFLEWCGIVGRLPNGSVGLTIGADIGTVFFRDVSSYFMAVGDAIVRARRLADTGAAGEVMVNDPLYERIKHFRDIRFECRRGSEACDPSSARVMQLPEGSGAAFEGSESLG